MWFSGINMYIHPDICLEQIGPSNQWPEEESFELDQWIDCRLWRFMETVVIKCDFSSPAAPSPVQCSHPCLASIPNSLCSLLPEAAHSSGVRLVWPFFHWYPADTCSLHFHLLNNFLPGINTFPFFSFFSYAIVYFLLLWLLFLRYAIIN